MNKPVQFLQVLTVSWFTNKPDQEADTNVEPAGISGCLYWSSTVSVAYNVILTY